MLPTVANAKKLITDNELNTHQRRFLSSVSLRLWTNIGLGIAVIIGFIVIWAHDSIHTAAIAAFGGALGCGGILGFLFGVPGSPKSVRINSPDSVAIGGSPGSRADAGSTVNLPAAPTADAAARGVTADPVAPAAAPAAPAAAALNVPAPDVAAARVVAAPAAAVAAPAAAVAAPVTSGTTEITSDSDSATTSSTSPNSAISNLEQVSDWVTKLLLGGGLTQMQRIPPKIWQWSHVVAVGMIGDYSHTPEQVVIAQQAFAAGLLVYGFVTGFFSGFLITRLQFSKVIVE